MSFFDFLEKIRNKPRYIRTQIMWVCVSFSMLLIIGLWSFSFKASINDYSSQENSDNELTDSFKRIKENTPTLIGSIKEGFGSFWNDLKDSLKDSSEEPKDQIDYEWEKAINKEVPTQDQDINSNDIGKKQEDKLNQSVKLPSRP